jgi:ribosome maturation factor RimP
MNLDKKVEENITMIVESLGLKVYDIDYSNAKIAIYIEKDDGNVTISDCENVSKNVSVMLDVEDPIPSKYTLEVSSPGINRILRKKEQFDAAVGKKCYFRTHRPIDSKKVFRGVLESVNDDGIVLKLEDNSLEIGFDNIKKARLDEI